MEGMFIDAVIYSSIARNLAEGYGSFWTPYFTEAQMATASFQEIPPLGYGIMSYFYRIFGSGIHTERIYTALSFLITAILIVKFWRMIWPTHYKMAWLPVLLWVLSTGVQFAFQNNLMENTQGIFVLGAAMALYRAFKAENRHLYWTVWGGLLIICAFLVKGLPSLFVMVTPLAMAISEKQLYKKAIIQSLALIGVLAVAGVALFLYEPARQSLEIYLFEWTAAQIENSATTENRYFILRVLAENLAIPGILTFVAGLIFSRINSERMQWEPLVTFMVILGIAGSLPFIATFVQRGIYLVPVYPFFALAMASVLRPVIEKTTSKWRRSPILQVSGWVLILFGIAGTIYVWNTPKQDEDIIREVKILDDAFTDRSILITNAELNQKWAFKAYLERYGKIAISDVNEHREKIQYIILPKGTSSERGQRMDQLSDQLQLTDVYMVVQE